MTAVHIFVIDAPVAIADMPTATTAALGRAARTVDRAAAWIRKVLGRARVAATSRIRKVLEVKRAGRRYEKSRPCRPEGPKDLRRPRLRYQRYEKFWGSLPPW